MTGFWTPALNLLLRLFVLWGRTLVDTAPTKLQPYLRVFHQPTAVSAGDFLQHSYLPKAEASALVVQVDEDRCLVYEFFLPECSGSELKRAVQIEAERIFPIHFSRLALSYRVLDHDTEKKTLHVEIVATRKHLIQDILDAASKRGLMLRAIEATSDRSEGAIEFPVAEISKSRGLIVAAVAIALITALLILFQTPSAYNARLGLALNDLDQKIFAARAATRKLASLQTEMREKQNLSSAIAAAKRQNRTVELIEEVSRVSPDHIVIDSFRLDGGRLYLSGSGSNLEEWALDLEAVPSFSAVVLTSVRNDAVSTRQYFELRLQVGWAEFGREVP